jgi:hypothetical protein
MAGGDAVVRFCALSRTPRTTVLVLSAFLVLTVLWRWKH